MEHRIIHNVHDHIDQFVGPWEVEPIDFKALNASDVGRRVVYQDSAGRAELGRLSSWEGQLVWVRFHQGETAASCLQDTLSWARRFASNHPNTPSSYP